MSHDTGVPLASTLIPSNTEQCSLKNRPLSFSTSGPINTHFDTTKLLSMESPLKMGLGSVLTVYHLLWTAHIACRM